MKALFISLTFLVFITASFSQKVVRIDFYDKAKGEYDLLIKELLDKNGYNSFIEYRPKSSTKPFDYLLKYEKEPASEFYEYKFELFGSDLKLINSEKRNINNGTLQTNEKNKTCKALSNLLNSKFECKYQSIDKIYSTDKIQVKYQKIDSAKYAIVCTSVVGVSQSVVEKAFLNKAKELLNEFDCYVEVNNKKLANFNLILPKNEFNIYNYKGIISKLSHNKNSPNFIENKPEEYDKYIDKTISRVIVYKNGYPVND